MITRVVIHLIRATFPWGFLLEWASVGLTCRINFQQDLGTHDLVPLVDEEDCILYVRISSPAGFVHEPNGHATKGESDDTNYGTEYSEYYGLGIVVWNASTVRWRSG